MRAFYLVLPMSSRAHTGLYGLDRRTPKRTSCESAVNTDPVMIHFNDLIQ